jgi:2-alkyl-3-oxoalkanoate reductase
VHIQDAAKAVVTSVYSNPGIYNIINDNPSSMKKWLPAFANFLGAPAPASITEEEVLHQKGVDWVYYATKLRAASNAKAKRLLDFHPRSFEWLQF